jgi:hypothetical protein
MDWLLHWYRQSSPKQNTIGLLTTYLKNDNKELTFNFLRFLSFLRKMEGLCQFIDDQVYYIIEFPVVDFLRFLGKDLKSTYQRNKVLDFLKSLQDLPPFVEKFSEIEFRSSIMFPLLKLRKTHQLWIFRIAVGEQLYCYSYPFIFSNCFRDFQNKYDLLV